MRSIDPYLYPWWKNSFLSQRSLLLYYSWKMDIILFDWLIIPEPRCFSWLDAAFARINHDFQLHVLLIRYLKMITLIQLGDGQYFDWLIDYTWAALFLLTKHGICVPELCPANTCFTDSLIKNCLKLRKSSLKFLSEKKIILIFIFSTQVL